MNALVIQHLILMNLVMKAHKNIFIPIYFKHFSYLPNVLRNIYLDPRWFRRANHTGGAGLILYYLIPEKLFFGISRIILPILLICIPVATELNRLLRKRDFIGLQKREKGKLASYFWFALGSAILLIFFPQEIAAPCIVTAALVDPLIGELRKFRKVITIAIGIIASFLIFSVFDYSISLAVVGAVIGVVVEYPNFKNFDDDLLMQLIPAIIILIIIYFDISLFEPFPKGFIKPLIGV